MRARPHKATLPSGRSLRALALVACLPLLLAWRWPTRNDRDVAEGQRFYRQGEFAEAARAFRRAMSGAAPSERLHFDLGTALLQQAMLTGQAEERASLLDQAIAALSRATGTSDLEVRERARYNLGNAQALRQRYADAIASYRDVLRDNAEHDDARYNLELVLIQMRRAKAGEGGRGQTDTGDEQTGPGEHDPNQGAMQPDGTSGSKGSDDPQGANASAGQEAGMGQGPGSDPVPEERGPEGALQAHMDPRGSSSAVDDGLDTDLTMLQKLEALERRSGELRRGNLLRKTRDRLRDPDKKGSQQ